MPFQIVESVLPDRRVYTFRLFSLSFQSVESTLSECRVYTCRLSSLSLQTVESTNRRVCHSTLSPFKSRLHNSLNHRFRCPIVLLHLLADSKIEIEVYDAVLQNRQKEVKVKRNCKSVNEVNS